MGLPPGAVRLSDLAWPELHEGLVLAVPIGSCEQHGPHLPLDTDTRIAVALADALSERLTDVVAGPAVAIAASGEHAGFRGTLSIGSDALTLLITELVRSADAFAGVVLVNGHGGNAEAVSAAVATLSDEGRAAMAWSPSGGDAHAGRTETSVLLHLDPAAVRLGAATAGDTRPLAELLPLLRAGGVAAVSPNGVLGDPSGASADEGRRTLDAWVGDLVAAVRAWR
jgi:mycofactocin precursor peptide peptidase